MKGDNMYYFGKNTIKGLIESKTALEIVYLNKGFKDNDFISFLKSNKVYFEFVDSKVLDEYSKNKNHQGVVTKVFEYQYASFEKLMVNEKNNSNSLIVILDGLEDPQNFGSIIRSAETVGANGIIIPKNRSVRVTPTVAKVSTGAINAIDIVQVTNLAQTIKKLKEEGYWIVGAHMETKTYYDMIDYNMKVALVVGSEGKGISNIVKKECDYLVKIPMYGQVSSLNVAVSTGIIMYQIDSSRRKLNVK